jgi:Mrp family chromosome partitioning ATPase
MSKNFELLQQAGKDIGSYSSAFKAPLPKNSSNGNGHRNGNGVDLDRMAQDELLKLVQRVFGTQGRDNPHAVMFASVDPGDGAGRLCAGTAKTLATSVPESVCVVDANPRSDLLPRILTATNYHGLLDALREQGPIRNFAQRLSPDNLWLLSCGSAGSDFASLSMSERLKTRLAELRTEFDYVLINVTPVTVDGTATALGPLIDGVILVVEANSTHREVARKARESLESVNARILGAVFNNQTFPIPSALYSRL